MSINKTNLLIYSIVIFYLFIFSSSASAASWYGCQTGQVDTFTCKDNQAPGCGTVMFASLEECKNVILSNGKKFYDSMAIEQTQAAKEAAAQALIDQQAIEKQLQADQAEIVKQAAEKQIAANEAAKAAELICDCTKSNNGQCRDDFNTIQEAVDYCNSCGIVNPQSSAVGCPLGSKEIGPFSCTCGTGDKAVCSTYDTFYDLDKKCSPTCGRSNGGCTVVSSLSLKSLQNKAKILNPAGFAFGSAGVTEIIGKIITFLMFPIGMFAMALYIWAGFLWMTAQGNSENVSKAKTILVWTTLGIIITLASYIIVQLVFTQIL